MGYRPIPTTSRTVTAVRTLQRKFREHRHAKFNRDFMAHVSRIQRRVRYWLGLARRRKHGKAVAVVVGAVVAIVVAVATAVAAAVVVVFHAATFVVVAACVLLCR